MKYFTPASAPWKAWYKSRRWQDLRHDVLLRDGYKCAMCGGICSGKHPADTSPIVDHKTAHRGDPVLFWDPTNLQVLHKAPCHDKHKQAQEQSTLQQRGMWH